MLAGKPTQLQQYARDISAAVETISNYCFTEGLQQPSFDPGAPEVLIPTTAPLEIHDARQQLIASAAGIQKLATEPAEYLPNLAIHYQVLACLRWLLHFKVLAHIPLEGSISYSELAQTAAVPEGQLRSISRMAITSNFLAEPVLGQIAHNPTSRLFITNSKLVDWAKFMTQFSMPTAACFAESTAKWGATEAKNETAFNIAMDYPSPLFDYFAATPDLAQQFASYMKSVQTSYGTSLSHLVSGFDWARLGAATVVDVGGSTCSSSVALAEAYPQLLFVVEDLPDTISSSPLLLEAQPPAIRDRISTCPHDFFTPQPKLGADVYLLRMILHDWPRKEASLILKNHLAALKANPKARMVIMDTVLPVPGSTSSVEEALLRVRDLTMIQAFNSHERELSEFEDLFMETRDEEGCLVLENVVKPPGSYMSVMEVAYVRNEKEINGVSGHSNGVHEL